MREGVRQILLKKRIDFLDLYDYFIKDKRRDEIYSIRNFHPTEYGEIKVSEAILMNKKSKNE